VQEAFDLLAGYDSPDAQRLAAKWNGLSAHDKKNVRLEEVIVACGLTTTRFWEILSGANFEHESNMSKFFVTRSQLKVLKSTVKAATDEIPITAFVNGENIEVGRTNGDVKAMEIFHKITGALATPKGSNFTFNQTIKKDSDEVPQVELTPLQSMDSLLMEIEDVRKPRQLSAPAAPVIPVEIPEGAPEIEYLDLGE